VFPDPATTLAAVDRLVHHATIFEMNVESYRRRTALQRKQHGPGPPAKRATPKNLRSPSSDDQQPASHPVCRATACGPSMGLTTSRRTSGATCV